MITFTSKKQATDYAKQMRREGWKAAVSPVSPRAWQVKLHFPDEGQSRRETLGELIEGQRNVGYKVRFVGDDELHDYAGANPEFGRVSGWPCPPKTFLVDKHFSVKGKVKVLGHEIVEEELMKRGWNYHDAHLEALAIERQLAR